MGLGHAVLCVERTIGDDTFAGLLSDDFLRDYEPDKTLDLAQAFASSGKSQLSDIKVAGSDISKYWAIVPNGSVTSIADLVEKLDANNAPYNLASIGRYFMMPNIFFETLRDLSAGSGREIQLAVSIKIHAWLGSLETACLNMLRFDCRSLVG